MANLGKHGLGYGLAVAVAVGAACSAPPVASTAKEEGRGGSAYREEAWGKAANSVAPSVQPNEPAAEAKPAPTDDAAAGVAVSFAPTRDSWQKGDELVAVLGLDPTAIVADIGADDGYFTLKLARAVPQGTVFAVEPDVAALRAIGEAAAAAGLTNIELALPQGRDLGLRVPVQLALLVNVVSRARDIRSILGQAARSLSEDGKLLVVDFGPGPMPVGPPPEQRIAMVKVEYTLRDVGFTAVRCLPHALKYQWVCAAGRLERGAK